MQNDKIAIVYSERDFSYIEPVINSLQESQYPIWNYTKSINGYGSLNEIAENILECKIIIVFLSHNFSPNSWQKKAVDLAKIENKKIILVFLEEIELSPGMQQFYSDSYVMKDMKDEEEILNSIEDFLDMRKIEK